MAPISSITSNRNKAFIAESVTFNECSDAFSLSDNWQREYHLLTRPKNFQNVEYKTPAARPIATSDKIALSGIILGTSFLIGGPIGLAASALLLTGCYGLDGIESANEQSRNSDGGENFNENNLRTSIDGGTHKNPTPTTTTWKKISAYGGNVCGVKMDGSIDCWGNDYDPEELKRNLTGTFDDVGVGGSHACGLRTNGEIKCSGNNFNNQAQDQSGHFIQVSAGFDHTCAITTEQHYIQCWGHSGFESEGVTNAPLGRFSYISAGGFVTCGIQSDNGAVNCWPNYASDPSVAFPQIAGRFIQVSVSQDYGCGVTMNDAIECWADPNYIANEHGKNHGQANPPSGSFSQVSVAGGFSCGLRTDQSIDCWGLLSVLYRVPQHMEGHFIQVVVSSTFIYAIKTDHSLECWGNSDICNLTPTP